MFAPLLHSCHWQPMNFRGLLFARQSGYQFSSESSTRITAEMSAKSSGRIASVFALPCRRRRTISMTATFKSMSKTTCQSGSWGYHVEHIVRLVYPQTKTKPILGSKSLFWHMQPTDICQALRLANPRYESSRMPSGRTTPPTRLWSFAQRVVASQESKSPKM